MQSRGGYGTISVEVNEMVVGLTMMKLARRKSTKARNTHTGQLDKILREAMEEREARDPDIDRERTKDNEYLKGYGQAEAIRSGDELARLLEARADRYGEARRAAGGRGVREDAGIGLAMIIKPPARTSRVSASRPTPISSMNSRHRSSTRIPPTRPRPHRP